MTETSYEDKVWLSLLTMNWHISQGIVFTLYISMWTNKKPFQQLNDDSKLYVYCIINKCPYFTYHMLYEHNEQEHLVM